MPKTIVVEKPWGNFKQYTLNEISTVKILTVNPNEILSLQSHKNRDELWVPLDEGSKVQLNDKTLKPIAGEEIFIPKNTKHRLSSLGKKIRILEISFGKFDENDIERYEDKYDRVK